jgi:mono/diheme cytochrome c family protein
MPNWSHLSESELTAVAAHVRRLGVDAVRAALERQVAAGQRTRGEAEATLLARTAPGPTIEVPPEPQPSESRLRRGREIYREACVVCHGEQGATPFGTLMTDFDGNHLPPTSLRHGVFKGGSEPEQLYLRVLRGMDGTAMPGYQGAYGPDDLWSLVQYVQSLSATGGSSIDTDSSTAVTAEEPAMAPGSPAARNDERTEPPEREESGGGRWLTWLAALAAVGLVGLLAMLALGSTR